MEAAAQRAMSLIDSAIDATNESWLDRVGNFFEGLGSFFADLATWVGDFLRICGTSSSGSSRPFSPWWARS
jgi:hypothetical protein